MLDFKHILHAILNKLPSKDRKGSTPVSFWDSANLDAFQRLRVSTPYLLIDTKRVGAVPDLLMTGSNTWSGSATYNSNRASTTLSVWPLVWKAIRQTKSRAIYQPAKSMMTLATFICWEWKENVVKRVGCFDNKNGIFFECNGSELSFNIRSFVTWTAVSEKVIQSNWNIDKLDGTGRSKITLDLTKPQIFFCDFEWLGVWRVRVGLVIDGCIVYCHEFMNANSNETSVYMSNPNLPIRWEIEALAPITGTSSIESICGSSNSEGWYEITGVTSSADTDGVWRVIQPNTWWELLAVRMKWSYAEFATAFIQQLSVLAATSWNFQYRIVLNPTVSNAWTWSDANTNWSIMEFATNRVINGNSWLSISSGYVASNANSITALDRPVLTFWTWLDWVTDVFSLQVYNLSSSQETFFWSLTWREIF